MAAPPSRGRRLGGRPGAHHDGRTETNPRGRSPGCREPCRGVGLSEASSVTLTTGASSTASTSAHSSGRRALCLSAGGRSAPKTQ